MDKQIAEMAKEVKTIRESYFGQNDYLFAKELFERGYRKIPEGAVVLTRDEFKAYSFVKEFFAGKSTKITAGELVRAFQLYDKQARKEAAEKYHAEMVKAIESVPNSTKEFVEAWKAKNDEIAKEITEGKNVTRSD